MGDGREYAILATPFQRDTGVNYQYKFTTTPGQWETLTIPYDQMFMSIRGFRPPIYPKLTGDEIHKVGLLIADKNDQDAFRLTVQIITAFNKQVWKKDAWSPPAVSALLLRVPPVVVVLATPTWYIQPALSFNVQCGVNLSSLSAFALNMFLIVQVQ